MRDANNPLVVFAAAKYAYMMNAKLATTVCRVASRVESRDDRGAMDHKT